MATNNIKPFGTSVDANLLTDEELSARSELQTGFPYKSKADSKLVGKLVQNATAGAYAVGEFSAKYGTQNVSGSDATGFATAFENALESYINEKAPTPDLSNYVEKEVNFSNELLYTGTSEIDNAGHIINLISEVTVGTGFSNSGTVLKPHLCVGRAGNVTLGKAVWGGVTIYDQGKSGTSNLVDNNNGGVYINGSVFFDLTNEQYGYVPLDAQHTYDIRYFATDHDLEKYMPLTGGDFTGAITVQEPTVAANPATKGYVDSIVASVYKYKGSVASVSALPSSDQTVGDVYNVEDTGDNYAWDGTQWDKLAGTVDLSNYLTTENASNTYLTKTDASSTYATKTEVTDGLGQKLAIQGSRGSLAGYENITVGSTAITINQDSPDSQQITSAVAITVSDGTANSSWVKKVSIKDVGATISLGSAWVWAGGSQPTVTAPSLLVLSWDNDCGIAVLQTTA